MATTDGTTIIGESILISGSLAGDEDLTVRGRVEGTLTLTRTLVVEPTGMVKAEVQVKNCIIAGVVVGNVAGRHFAFVGLERIGGVIIFDVTDPTEPRYVSYTNNRDFNEEDVETGDAGDLGPEGLVFIEPEDSPNGQPLLVVGNEVSGSTTIYLVNKD